MQAARLEVLFPKSVLSHSRSKLLWTYFITPSPLSHSYEVGMEYKLGKHPDVCVLSPKLELYEGETRLPHVYDTTDQRLCLYYRQASEWDSGRYIADTIIPWTCEWLLHYEYWLATGNWHGHGITHLRKNEQLKL